MEDTNIATEAGIETTQGQEEKAYSQAEVDKLLQSETDKRVTEALKTREAKIRQEAEDNFKKQIQKEKELAELSAEEKAKKIAEEKANEIAQREKEIQRKELLFETKGLLQEKGLPLSFAEMLVAENNEETFKRVNEFQKAFQENVESVVQTRLKSGYKPTAGTAVSRKQEIETKLKDPNIKLEDKIMLKRELTNLQGE